MNGLLIEKLAASDLPALHELLMACPFSPLDFWEGSSEQAVSECWLDDIQKALLEPNSSAVVARLGASIAGFVLLTEQPWETCVIGKRIFVIKHIALAPDASQAAADSLVGSVCKIAKLKMADSITAKVSTLDIKAIHAFERHQFRLMDTALNFTFDYGRMPVSQLAPPRLSESTQLGLATEADSEALMLLARQAFGGHFGRFHADKRIGRDIAAKVYEKWMQSALNGWADLLIVAKCDDKIAGYSIWKKPSASETKYGFHLGHYSIAGIHPDYFGLGLFSALTYEGMRRLPELGQVNRLEGPTHANNYPVHRGYLKLGWRITGARHTFHCWLDDIA